MQPSDRGEIEQSIEKIISDEQILVFREEVKLLLPYVKSIDDAVFGLIFGTIMTICSDHFLLAYRRSATKEEQEEIFRVIKDRVPQIKSQIAKT